MFSKPLNFLLIVALLAFCQPPACNSELFHHHNGASLSQASSTAKEHQLSLGHLGLSRGVVKSKSETENNGGFENGGTTSIASSKAIKKGVHLGHLDIGSTLTASKTKTNDAVSRGVAHDLSVGSLDLETSLSRDNLHKGLGIHRGQDGGLELGLGLINLDLTKKHHQQESQSSTQAQAQAQGEDAFAAANSKADAHSRKFGLLGLGGLTKTNSESNAISGTSNGQSSAQANGLASGVAGHAGTFGGSRLRRSTDFVRPKRKAQFIPFSYQDREIDQFVSNLSVKKLKNLG